MEDTKSIDLCENNDEPDVICFQYSDLVCTTCIKLIEFKSNKKFKGIKWKMSKVDHERIIEDDIPLRSYF